MGIYLNPGNEGFQKDSQSRIYVDKTLLIKEMNLVLGEAQNCISVSHARRFGKSQAAGMLEAYYSRGCTSKDLFAGFAIAKEVAWDKYLNKFNVIHLDMSTLVNKYKEGLVDGIINIVYKELIVEYPGILDLSYSFSAVLKDAFVKSGIRFVIIIDEWDCVIRNFPEKKDFVHEYMQFLHDLFKSDESKSFLALGYITGILPIKKIQDESALNNFMEFTMLSSKPITQYYGFTESEVEALCQRYNMDFESIMKWYDGYTIDGLHMYNPNSVYSAMLRQQLDSYWKNTSSFESLSNLIMLDMDGLKEDVLNMLTGGKAAVDVNGFKNDLSVLGSKDDVLTALIHLGYLAYDGEMEEAFIPNYEVAIAYNAALSDGNWSEVAKSIATCRKALNAIIAGRAEELASYIDMAHEAYTSIKNYNDENAMYNVLYMTLFTARAFYNVERELPAGKGFADMVLIPRKNVGNKPAILMELKYNKSADTAIRQIKEKRYAGKLQGYTDKIMLVGINYDKETKQHACMIEEYIVE